MVINYEVMYQYSLDDSACEFQKRFNTYEEAEAWITDTLKYYSEHRIDARFIGFSIRKVYRGI